MLCVLHYITEKRDFAYQGSKMIRTTAKRYLTRTRKTETVIMLVMLVIVVLTSAILIRSDEHPTVLMVLVQKILCMVVLSSLVSVKVVYIVSIADGCGQ